MDRQIGIILLLTLATVIGCYGRHSPTVEEKSLDAKEFAEARNAAAGLMGQFKYDEAVGVLRSLVKSPQASDDTRIDLAIALLNRRKGDDLKESASILEAVIKNSPDNLRAHYCRALLWFNAGETAKAQAAFEKVVKGDPKDAYSVYYVGQCMLGLGKYADAVEQFRRAGELDPYLRSASFGESQALRRLGDLDGFKVAMNVFQRLGTNPRARIAELKYTRMGPKATVQSGQSIASPFLSPEGPIFDDPVPLAVESRSALSGKSLNITVADINGDGVLDLFAAQPEGVTQVLLGRKEGFVEATHPLTGIAGVNTALWGDYDNDGLTDVYLCRRGRDQIWRQAEGDRWEDVTDQLKMDIGPFNTVDGACYDFDHDGDLDYLLVHSDSTRELFSNNRDGSFKPLAKETGIAGDPSGSRRLMVADLDRDDDADLVFLNEGRPHEVFLNDRLWNYHAAEGFAALAGADIGSAIAVDADVDGQTELYTASQSGIERWTASTAGVWSSQSLSEEPTSQLIAYDFDGDTAMELATAGKKQWQMIDAISGDAIETHSLEAAFNDFTLFVSSGGPELMATSEKEPPLIWKAGPGRLPFVRVRLTGKTDRGAEMRSNASGIGVSGVARVGQRWAPLAGMRPSSVPGQSLQPQAIGTGSAGTIDFIRLLWPDGVSQTERGLRTGQLYKIPETQRQAGSCPLLFVWDGEQYAFVADMLGAGGIGFNLGRGEYYPARPEESLLLPSGLLKPKNDRLIVKLGEPMEEVCYFDAVRLVAYDLPSDWSMLLDERFAGMGPSPTGEPIFYQQELLPVVAKNDRGADVTVALRTADGNPAPLARIDRRFIGLNESHTVTVEFEQSIDELLSPVLAFNGWVEYPYSQSAFAAWQAGETFVEPTIEAQGSDGAWVVVAERFGYPAGTSRQGSVALPKELLPKGARKLRITSNMQVYWDRLSIVERRSCSRVKRHEVPLVTATVADVGFSTRQIHPHRRSVYDYADRPPFGDARHPAGYYTRFGTATELVTAIDDAVAIIGPGEEIHLEFSLPDAAPPPGWQRRWVIEADGWCKDADLFTQNAGTVGPLPRRQSNSPTNKEISHREKLHGKYNTRFRSGY